MPAVKYAVTREDPACRGDALAELGLRPSASDDEVRDAFRLRIKAAHPDLNGGTDTLLRRLILARDLLMADTRHGAQAVENLDPSAHDEPVRLEISLAQAIFGGEASAEVPALDVVAASEALTSLIEMTQIKVPLTPGLRTGEIVTVMRDGARKALFFRVHIVCHEGRRIWGHDIWMTAPVPARLFATGGTAQIDTPHGPREVTLERDTAPGSSLCLKGLGLPATEACAAGDLHVRLEADADEARPYIESLDTFRQRWAS